MTDETDAEATETPDKEADGGADATEALDDAPEEAADAAETEAAEAATEPADDASDSAADDSADAEPEPEPEPEPDAEPEAEAEATEPDVVAVPVAPLDVTLTGSGRRFGAYVLDALLIVVLLGIGWFIWSLVVWSKGQSPGKALLGMRVVKADTGRAATWGTMFVREIAWKAILGTITGGITTIVSGFMILGSSRQGIWDKLAGTVVVDDPDGRHLG